MRTKAETAKHYSYFNDIDGIFGKTLHDIVIDYKESSHDEKCDKALSELLSKGYVGLTKASVSKLLSTLEV